MLIKSADDKTQDITSLRTLLSRSDVDASTKKKVKEEIRNIQSGIKGEREAAYEMEFHYGSSRNWFLIHDLRIEYKGRVAQIDHLILNRFMEIYVCESKRFAEGIAINDQGEYSAFYGGKPYGVPSPVEQNRKHILVLQSVLDDGFVNLPTRLAFALKPSLKSLVLVSKTARISRPKTNLEDLDCIIKNDQLRTRIDRDIGNQSGLAIMSTMAKVVASETIEGIARQIAALHTPVDINWAARFGISKVASVISRQQDTALEREVPVQENKSYAERDKPKSKLICYNCGEAVTYNVAKFCWMNKARFGGNVYCIGCQKNVTTSTQV